MFFMLFSQRNLSDTDCGIFLLGKPSFTKKQADLFFPPDFADDFPVSMQVEYSFLLIC